MKKCFSIFLVVLLVVSCVEPLGNLVVSEHNAPDENDLVTLTFSLPPKTKSLMAHDPSISTIHVAVFNQSGVLKQFEQATLKNPGNVTNGSTSSNPEYSVDVYMSKKPRILHFIADIPESLNTYEKLVAVAGTTGEETILNAITTEGGQAAYWQRVELDNIDAYKYEGGVYTPPDGSPNRGSDGATSYSYTVDNQTITVNVGDYIKKNGDKVLDGTGYFQSNAVAAKLASIPLVRNFAEITVTSLTGSNFVPQEFYLVNVPTKGFVAPFDANSSRFAPVYTASTTDSDDHVLFTGVLSHSSVAATSYPGMLAGSLDTSDPSSDSSKRIDLTDTDPTKHVAFMYERPLPNVSQPATCILVGGNFTKDGVTKYRWFCIELNKDGVYFPIYRGISYDIKIGTISGTDGYEDAQAAYAGGPLGDVSSSVLTSTLTEINDGKGTTLWVEYIDYVATDAEASRTLYYTMVYEPSSGPRQYLFDNISFSVSHKAGYNAIVGSVDDSDTNEYQTGTPDNNYKWKKVSVQLDDPDSYTIKRSTLHVEGITNDNMRMYRDVSYRVMPIQQFAHGNDVLKGTPLENEDAGKETTLTIYLPEDLGLSVFPSTIRIEAENQNFTSVDGLPVEYGPSLFDPSKKAFYFIKTINYSDYYDPITKAYTCEFEARFKTTRDGTSTSAGTNATEFAIQDKPLPGRTEPYFETATCYVPVGDAHVFKLSTNAVTVKAQTTEARFRVISSSAGTWNLTASSSDVTLSQTNGVGCKEIVATFPANTSETSPVTYTITANCEGFDSQSLRITQNYRIFDEIKRIIGTTASTFNSNYVYVGDYNSELSIIFTGGKYRSSNYLDFNPSGSGVTVSSSNYTITKIVITWYGSSYAANRSTIGSGGGSIVNTNSYPYTTTWTGSSNEVVINFARNSNSTTEFSSTQIEITYLKEITE